MKKEHTDHQGHVNNVQYLQWASEMASAHWEEVIEEVHRSPYIWVVKDHFIEYKKVVFEGDTLDMQTYIAESQGLKSTRMVEFYRDDVLVTRVKTTWVMLDKISNRPKVLAAELAQRFL